MLNRKVNTYKIHTNEGFTIWPFHPEISTASRCSSGVLEVHDKLVTKTIQLFETFMVRFGVMLVGPTLGGKTAGNLRVAAKVLLLPMVEG